MTPQLTLNFVTPISIRDCVGMGPSRSPETIINGLSDVKLVEYDTSADFEFFDPHPH